MVNNNAIRFLDFYIQQTSGNFAEGEAAYATNVEVCIFLKSELQKGSIMKSSWPLALAKENEKLFP